MDTLVGVWHVTFLAKNSPEKTPKELDLSPQVSDFWDIHGHGDGCTSVCVSGLRGEASFVGPRFLLRDF